MALLFISLGRTAKSLSLIVVGALSVLGALSIIHVGTAQARTPSINQVALIARLNADEVEIKKQTAMLSVLRQKTAPINVSGTELTFTGVNVHILSGSGSTSDGTELPDGREIPGKRLTGLGNLIIGYNKLGNDIPNLNAHIGSHNLVLGDANKYVSFGGLIAGRGNSIAAPYASISGGDDNQVVGRGFCGSVSGGSGNTVKNFGASVSGGGTNTASGMESSVSGGELNTASGQGDAVSGGDRNICQGQTSSISGGSRNTVSVPWASVSGGNNLSQITTFGWSGGNYHSP